MLWQKDASATRSDRGAAASGGGQPTAGASRARIPAVVRALGVVSLLNDLASEMVYPLLPALVRNTLGGGAIALGALDGVSDAVSAGVKLAAGRLGDRRRWRRPLIVGGYLVAAAVRPLNGLSSHAWQVIGLRAVDRVGKGARNPPRDTVIADATPAPARGRAFGFHRAMDHAGATIGPLVAGGLLAWAALPVDRVILLSAVPGAMAVIVAAVALRREETVPSSGEPAKTDPVTRDPTVPQPPRAVPLVLLVVLFAAVRVPETLFLLRVQDLGVATAAIPVLWSALHLVRTAASYPGGWLSDRLGPARTMLIGWVVYAGAAFGLSAVRTPWAAAALLPVLGVVSACTEAPERALVAAWGGRSARGRRFGIYHAGVGLAALPGGLAFGAAYAWKGGSVAFAASAALALVLTLAGAGMARASSRRPPVADGTRRPGGSIR